MAKAAVPGTIVYIKGDWSCGEMPDKIDVNEVCRDSRGVIVERSDGTLLVVDLFNRSGKDGNARCSEYCPGEDHFPTLSEALRASARDELAYGELCFSRARKLEMAATEADKREAKHGR